MHWYGKAEVAPQRKVGHVTIVAPTREEARNRLACVDAVAAALLSSVSPPGASISSALVLHPFKALSECSCRMEL